MKRHCFGFVFISFNFYYNRVFIGSSTIGLTERSLATLTKSVAADAGAGDVQAARFYDRLLWAIIIDHRGPLEPQ